MERIDGALTYVVVIACETIKFSLLKEQPKEIPKSFIGLQELQNCLFFKETTPYLRIEGSLLILSILAYKIEARKDLQYAFLKNHQIEHL